MTQKSTYKVHLFVVVTSFITILSTLFPRSAVASINEAFTYQGKIVNNDGTNLTNSDASCIQVSGADTCDVRVSLYTADSGGTLVWQETKSNIEIYDNHGLLNLILDCGGSFSSCNQNGGPDFTSGQLFIEVEFDPDGDGDFSEGETFSPRRELTAVPYAFNAATADSADALNGIDSSSFLRSDTSDTLEAGVTLSVDGTLDVNGNIDIDGDITVSSEALVFDGAYTEFSLAGDLSINTNDLFVEKSSGFVGVGTTNPTVELDIAGSVRATSQLDVEGFAAFGNGSTLDANSGLTIDYDATYTGEGQQLLVRGNTTGAASTNLYGARIAPENLTIPAGTTNLAASLRLDEPSITEAGTLINSATLYIAGAATEADNNFALWVDAGDVQIDEDLTVNTDVIVGNDIIIGGTNQSNADIFLGSDGIVVINEQGNDSDFRIDGSGPSLEAIFFADASSGRIGVGTSGPSAYLDLPASDFYSATIRVRSGSAPSSPNEGDMYADGSSIYYRDSLGQWVDLAGGGGGGGSLQESYVEGSSIDVTSAEGALAIDLQSADFTIEVGQGTDTGDFRIWNGTENWLFIDESASSLNLGNTAAATSLSLASGSNWSISSSGAVAGVTTMASSDDWTWSANTPSIIINNGEVFSISDGNDTFGIDMSNSSFGFSDGSNGFNFDVDTGPNYSGTARPTKKIVLSPEYSGAVLTSFYGAGTDTNITGTMVSDAETTPASNIRSFYSWERANTTQHYYTVAIRITLPEDFSEWTTSNSVIVNYVTESATNTDSDVDVRIYLEGNATADASATDLASTSWATTSFSSSDLNLWNSAGETAVIYLRLGSQSGNYARVGDIELNYLASY